MMHSRTNLNHDLERHVRIRAPRPIVFSFFTDSALFARWWGEGSTIEGRVGGAVRIVYPNAVVALGEVRELVADERVVFTFGFEDPSKPIAPGGSLVTVTLEDDPVGTLLHLRHEFSSSETRDGFVQGWHYQLALFANAAAGVAHANAAGVADAWFAAWNEPDATARRAAFAACAEPGVEFGDAFSCTAGLDDLSEHVGAAHVHMPGVRIERSGAPRACQGLALVDWSAKDPSGAPVGTGTNAFEFTSRGRIARVVGFWGP